MNRAEQLCMGCMAEKSEEGICPICGYDSRTSQDPNYLIPGTALGDRYIVGALKHRNGERGEYIGYDTEQEVSVWVREYFPYTIAYRETETGAVVPNAGYGAQYKALMSDYVDVCNEVKRLSVSDPVIPIDNILGENNTVYAIYRHMDLLSLEEYLTTRGGKLSYDEAVEILTPLFHAVDNMHLRGVIHRGLSPYTIFVSQADTLYMDGFSLSGTRTAGSELQAELFNGYSAPEQYAAKGWQGNWTDVYALAAIFYRTVSGIVPPKSTMVSSGRALASLGDLVSSVPPQVSRAIDEAMRTNTSERTQTVGALVSEIHRDENIPRTAVFDFVPTIGETPSAPAHPPVDEYGHTEEVNLEDIEAQFYFSDDEPVRTPQGSRRSPLAQTFGSDDYDEYYPEEEASGARVNRGIVVTLIVVAVAIAIFLAVRLTNDLLAPDKSSEPSSPEVSGEENPQPDLTPSTSSEEESKKEKKKVEIPDFTGKDAESVQRDSIYKEYFTFKIISEESDEVEEGKVISQKPRKETTLEIEEGEKEEIELVVSKGSAKLTMPNVTGMSHEQALEALDRFAREEKSVFTVNTQEIYAPETPAGVVVRTSPEPGKLFDPKTEEVEILIAMAPLAQESDQREESSKQESSKQESSKEESSRPTRAEDGTDLSPNVPPKR